MSPRVKTNWVSVGVISMVFTAIGFAFTVGKKTSVADHKFDSVDVRFESIESRVIDESDRLNTEVIRAVRVDSELLEEIQEAKMDRAVMQNTLDSVKSTVDEIRHELKAPR